MALWRRELLGLGLKPDVLLAEVPFDWAQAPDRLRKCTYAAFQHGVQTFGARLAGQGIRLERVIAALNRLFELSVAHLHGEPHLRAGPVLALARLHSLVSLLVVSGYTGQWTAGTRTPAEAGRTEQEDRRRGASAYVTRIYEQERRQLSQDLHDEVGHDLMLIKLYLEMIAMHSSENDPETQGRIAEAIALVSHSIDSVRRLVLDLGPAVFEDLGFLPALRSYISQFSSRTKIKVDFQEGFVPKDIPSTHQVALYRLMQGALSNVFKHSKAKGVQVSLGSMNGSVLIMVIEDDGVGFDTSAKLSRKSFGLTAMRERVEVLGGKIHIQSKRAAPGRRTHGTRIEVDIPLPDGSLP